MSLISLSRVGKEYCRGHRRVVALRDVDLAIERGDFVAVWGPSGSGKSTLCNILGLIDTPSVGEVLVGGRAAAAFSDDERSDYRSRSLGFIFQRFNLVGVLSALENAALPLRVRGVGAREAARRAMGLLEELGIGGCAGQRPDLLSGGQQQRVAIARALVTDPPLVIADEPTANLDTDNALRIVEIMGEINRSRGTTFVFSTHDQRLLARVRRLVRLDDGRVVEDRVHAC